MKPKEPVTIKEGTYRHCLSNKKTVYSAGLILISFPKHKEFTIAMPIKSLESFLFENKLVNTSSIEILQNATIGIDVEHYLSRIYTFKKEQFLSGIGGVPSSLKQYIQSDLSVFEESNIRPLFVLPGLKINHFQKTYLTNELSPQEQHLDATWARLQSKQTISGGNSFGFNGDSFRFNLDPLPIKPMLNDLIKLFIECGVDYMISPYDASFQLSYLYSSKVIDCIYGSTDVLVTNVDKFILGMEFQSKDFRFVDKQRVLNELNLTERQFLDLSIMVGCSAQPETFSNLPPLPKMSPASPFPQMNYFRMALDILFQYASVNGPPADLFAYITNLNDPSLLDLYYKGHAAIKFMPIMNTDGYVELFGVEMSKLGYNGNNDLFKNKSSNSNKDQENSDDGGICVPTELHSVLSQRLPPEIYFYQSLGLLPLKLLESITSGECAVRPPLATGNGDAYKRLISSKKLQTIMDFQFNLITQLLARYYQVKRIEVIYWFRKEPLYLNNRLEPTVSARLRAAKSCQIIHGTSSSIWSVFQNVSSENDSSLGTEEKDLVSTSFRRALFLMQVLDEQGNFSEAGKIMKRFCEENPDLDNKLLEGLFLLLIFFEAEGLDSISPDESFGKCAKGSKDNFANVELNSDEVKRIFLISRIFSIQKFNIHPINYQGPISRSLLAFRSHLKVFHEMAQNSLLVCFVDLIVRDEEFKSRNLAKEKWSEILDRVPFYNDLNNTLLGVISEIYFSTCLKSAKSGTPADQCIEKSKDYLMDFVFQVGKPSYNINLNSVNSVTPDQFKSDFSEGLKFWNLFKRLAAIATEIEPSFFSVSDQEVIKGADITGNGPFIDLPRLEPFSGHDKGLSLSLPQGSSINSRLDSMIYLSNDFEGLTRNIKTLCDKIWYQEVKSNGSNTLLYSFDLSECSHLALIESKNGEVWKLKNADNLAGWAGYNLQFEETKTDFRLRGHGFFVARGSGILYQIELKEGQQVQVRSDSLIGTSGNFQSTYSRPLPRHWVDPSILPRMWNVIESLHKLGYRAQKKQQTSKKLGWNPKWMSSLPLNWINQVVVKLRPKKLTCYHNINGPGVVIVQNNVS
ncbi:hypothetical protein JCM33374_g195 [Metschnikowia sp. JCM 33374]|nr:hypothetical protein JCM33374_g195 [Metschnikowia sp. JCM 33374]